MGYDSSYNDTENVIPIKNDRIVGNLMAVKIGIIMDPIESINFKKDTTLAILLAAQIRD